MANQDVAAFIGYGNIMRHIRQGEADLEIPQTKARTLTSAHPSEDSLVGAALKIRAAIIFFVCFA